MLRFPKLSVVHCDFSFIRHWSSFTFPNTSAPGQISPVGTESKWVAHDTPLYPGDNDLKNLKGFWIFNSTKPP